MRARKTGKWVVFALVALILALTYTAFFGVENYYGDIREVTFKGAKDIRWGIDIRGGVEAVFSPDIDADKITDESLESAKTIMEKKLVGNNITDYEVYCDSASKQIIVRFPWTSDETAFDPKEAIKELAQDATLEFREGESETGKLLLSGTDVKSATAGTDTQSGQPLIYLDFTSSGTSKFAEATRNNLNKTISIWLVTSDTEDDEDTLPQYSLVNSATVNSVIQNGSAVIEGISSSEEALQIARQINAGNLPFSLSADNGKIQIISPTLGNDALTVMLIAGIVAFGIICVIMIGRYRLPGVIASFSLLGQIAAMIACISGYVTAFDSFTLTIPGIAGIILSIGVGVDANVIAAERIKEEFAKGKTIDGAIDAGYKNCVSAIIDGNVTIVIVSIVLMGAFGSEGIFAKLIGPIMSLFGSTITGSIYSFGYTLLIGVIFNLLLGVLASKWMIKSISRIKLFRKPVLFGGAKNV
ncbi:MAG: protein translocase subunit SecD [Clostridia bacterium]|nr:protein translocase subunit SecD [Clostridia bacterium]